MANQIILAGATGIVPALIWLWFWLKEDRRHPEPRSLLTLVFGLGALAVIPAFLIERQLYHYFSFNLEDKNALLAGVLVWSAVEETLKFLMVYFAAFHDRNYNEPVDAMVYMITGAVGFSAL
jgi:protease PrsW